MTSLRGQRRTLASAARLLLTLATDIYRRHPPCDRIGERALVRHFSAPTTALPRPTATRAGETGAVIDQQRPRLTVPFLESSSATRGGVGEDPLSSRRGTSSSSGSRPALRGSETDS